VIRRDAIVLRVGSGRWLRVCHGLVGLVALALILSSGSGLVWMLLSLGVLAAVHGGVVGTMRGPAATAELILHADGSAVLRRDGVWVGVQRCSAGWVSRWCCVVTVHELLSERRVHCLVCRSLNTSDAYRRLLVTLRLARAHAADRGVTWL
jgi:hypothetical protein